MWFASLVNFIEWFIQLELPLAEFHREWDPLFCEHANGCSSVWGQDVR